MTKAELNKLFMESLGASVVADDAEAFPLECEYGDTPAIRLRVYLFTITRQHGGRPQDEYKIQVILPGQKPRTKVALDTSDGRLPIIGGFSQDFNAFVFWDATLYSGFSYSRNMQVKEITMANSFSNSIALQKRWLRQSGVREQETIMACQPSNLARCIYQRVLGVSGE